ncbi:hypothetical protein Moror_5139 [Moniliophthora roreri MCA 2997]|uniref:Uncharacterized protein n=1 Tax=Moniliophthora roreri (strain MCA 2997) TaxID=1381753 RepID=V2YC45_MONRO|nr:hypothetical protein Moror_5139 [Moniliophthora roreri MCA 2997]
MPEDCNSVTKKQRSNNQGPQDVDMQTQSSASQQYPQPTSQQHPQPAQPTFQQHPQPAPQQHPQPLQHLPPAQQQVPPLQPPPAVNQLLPHHSHMISHPQMASGAHTNPSTYGQAHPQPAQLLQFPNITPEQLQAMFAHVMSYGGMQMPMQQQPPMQMQQQHLTMHYPIVPHHATSAPSGYAQPQDGSNAGNPNAGSSYWDQRGHSGQ